MPRSNRIRQQRRRRTHFSRNADNNKRHSEGPCEFAWEVRDFQLSGGPRWFDTDRFDIAAKSSGAGEIDEKGLRLMLQSLLTDRFKLRVHSEKREVTAYSLVIARNPPSLVAHTGEGESSSDRSNGHLVATKATTARLAGSLSQILGRPVADDTGLKGEYDYKLDWSAGDQPDSQLPSIFAAVQEQLGLKLNTTKARAEILIIDRAERPIEN